MAPASPLPPFALHPSTTPERPPSQPCANVHSSLWIYTTAISSCPKSSRLRHFCLLSFFFYSYSVVFLFHVLLPFFPPSLSLFSSLLALSPLLLHVFGQYYPRRVRERLNTFFFNLDLPPVMEVAQFFYLWPGKFLPPCWRVLSSFCRRSLCTLVPL